MWKSLQRPTFLLHMYFFCCWNFNTYYSFWKLQIKHVKATAYQNCNPTVAIPEDSFVNINDELLQIG